MKKITTVMMILAAALSVGCSAIPMQPGFTTQAGLLKTVKGGEKTRSTLSGREFGQCVARDSRDEPSGQGIGGGEIHRTSCIEIPLYE
ncbi:MAG: hypothetical protein H7338_01445 [Candidatus Sericytochromatia bacterium]|nr:hypothetical protein [Candidatus Sericytochromatia bacterium]